MFIGRQAGSVPVFRVQDARDVDMTPGAGVDGYALTWNNSQSRLVLADTAGQGQYFNVLSYGADRTGVTDATEAIQEAIVDANAAGAGSIVYLPSGTYKTTGISLNGMGCTLWGDGRATTIQAASGITNYVIDMTGFTAGSFLRRIQFGNFAVVGDNTAGAAKGGVHFSGTHGVVVDRLTVTQTGGPGVLIDDSTYGGSHFMDFQNCIVGRPVDAGVNNVPYLEVHGVCNGIVFTNFGFRSTVADASAENGVVYVHENSLVNYPSQLRFRDCWLEYCRAYDGSGLITHVGTTLCEHDGWMFFDSGRAAGASNVAYFKFMPGILGSTFGGNSVRGHIPGGYEAEVDHGVILSQSRNSVIGVRGYRDENVKITSGVQYCAIQLFGSVSGNAESGYGVLDESGNNTNSWWDALSGEFRIGATVYFGLVPEEAETPLISVFDATPSSQHEHIADPSGGVTQDSEARTAINAILAALEGYGWLKTS